MLRKVTWGRSGAAEDDVTGLLERWRDCPRAADRLVHAIYPRLRQMAARELGRDRSDESMHVSDLVHEALLPLLSQRRARFRDRRHLFAVAAQLIRRTLVDRLRRRRAEKRGGRAERVSIDTLSDTLALRQPKAHPELEALEDALSDLERIDAESARVVELRYFAGLSLEETASALGIGRSSLVRRWSWARAWLEERLTATA